MLTPLIKYLAYATEHVPLALLCLPPVPGPSSTRRAVSEEFR